LTQAYKGSDQADSVLRDRSGVVPAPGSPEKICAAIEEQQWADPVDLADLMTAMELSVGVGEADAGGVGDAGYREHHREAEAVESLATGDGSLRSRMKRLGITRYETAGSDDEDDSRTYRIRPISARH